MALTWFLPLTSVEMSVAMSLAWLRAEGWLSAAGFCSLPAVELASEETVILCMGQEDVYLTPRIDSWVVEWP